MTKKLPPPPLRLHIADEPAGTTRFSVGTDIFEAVAKAFEGVTGWSLERVPGGRDTNSKQPSRLSLGALRDDRKRPTNLLPIDKWRAAELADAIAELYVQLATLESAVWQREAELAIGVPVSPRRQGEPLLAARLEVML